MRGDEEMTTPANTYVVSIALAARHRPRRPFSSLSRSLIGRWIVNRWGKPLSGLRAPADVPGVGAGDHRGQRKGAPVAAAVLEREQTAPTTRAPLIELAAVEKVYRMGRLDYPALRGIDLEIGAGELVAIVGPSGSGKTTILNLVTGIDRPSAGTVTVDGLRIDAMSEEELAVWRGEHVGVVFQFFQLLPTLSALENATLPLDFARRGSKGERFERARHNLELVGLGDKADHLPAELSGGEQQRVAIARALASDPKLIVGDEPTGNLDSVTAGEMFELLGRLNDEGKTILYVTHDLELAGRAHRIITIRDGVVVT
jgi:putative ABC transport system ATP-binding protein